MQLVFINSGLAVNRSRHLLGKKSWNVYNQDNIERVRRDEARAKAAEEEAEHRKKDNDAAERLRILRGEHVEARDSDSLPNRENKRKRDSDYAPFREDIERAEKHIRRSMDSRPVLSGDRANVTQDPLDHIPNMRLRDAAGRNPDSLRPWYSVSAPDKPSAEVGRDVWGNEDAGRQARDQKRLDASDPLLAMKRGVKQLKELEKQKSEWRKERERDLHEVEDLARKGRHRRRKEDKYKHHREKRRSKGTREDRHQHTSRERLKSDRGEGT